MTKEDQIIQMIAEVAEQGTQQMLDVKDELGGRLDRLEARVGGLETKVDKLDQKIDGVETSLRGEMQNLRNENAKFFDEIIGFLRHDEEIRELQLAARMR